ncbi:MAG: response regulator transcription factor [Synergistaceae bacterium]|nr:response regulator transcription factor [Synergistaceae bacterium]
MTDKITIVLADDHPLTREGMKAFLTAIDDFSVVGEYADGEEAWEGIQALRPQVALLDIRMPKLDGVSLARKIQAAKFNVKTLMLTSYDAQQYVIASLRAGASGYVLKTIAPDSLAHAIRTVAKGGVYLDSEVSSMVNKNFPPESVSTREREVMTLAAQGLSGKEIADRLYISERTVQTHLASIYDKLGAKNKTEAMLLAIKYGIVTLDELMANNSENAE